MEGEEGPTSSWLTWPDLLAFDGLPPVAPEVADLAYESQRNLWSGASESGKTWAAIAAAVAEINAGRDVLWIDTDGMGERATLERLLCLGATREAVRDHFRYAVPSDKLTRPVVDALLSGVKGRLVVVDSFNATMGLQGLDPNVGGDVETFWQTFDPFCRAGFALVCLDHVTKSAEGRGVYAIGSERKHSGAHAHLGFATIGNEKIVRDGTGRSTLTVNKDRGAYFMRPVAHIFSVTIEEGRGSWNLSPARGDEGWKPTALMEQVSRYLAGCILEQPSKSEIVRNVKGKTTYVREAIDALVAGGYVREIEDGQAKRYECPKPYHEADDLTPSHPVPERDGVVPGDPKSDPVPRPRSIGDGDGTEDQPRPETWDGVSPWAEVGSGGGWD